MKKITAIHEIHLESGILKPGASATVSAELAENLLKRGACSVEDVAEEEKQPEKPVKPKGGKKNEKPAPEPEANPEPEADESMI